MKHGMVLLLCVCILGCAAHKELQNTTNYISICPNENVQYCRDVGKEAFLKSNVDGTLADVSLGTITGVTWQKRGSVVSVSEAMPEIGIKQRVRKAPRSEFYYIINNAHGKPYIRRCKEIEPR